MYNSRPRKMSYDGYPEGFAVPENYSGNAFRENVEASEYRSEELPFADSDVIDENTASADEEAIDAVAKPNEENQCRKGHPLSRTGFGFNVANLFKGGIGFEELLIIGLIFLIAQGDNNEDIIVLLALLLFIG